MIDPNYIFYYLGKAERGDAKAAFEAAKLMRENNWDEVMIQTQLRRSAELGYVPAQRYLGFLGLSLNLIRPESKAKNPIYYDTYEPAINWIAKAADNKDPYSMFALIKCTQLGIGVEKDEIEAERMSREMASELSMDIFVSVMFIIEAANRCERRRLSPNLSSLLSAS